MKIKDAMYRIEAVGRVFREAYERQTGRKVQAEGWRSDFFNGLSAYCNLDLKGFDNDLDMAYNVSIAYLSDEVMYQMNKMADIEKGDRSRPYRPTCQCEADALPATDLGRMHHYGTARS